MWNFKKFTSGLAAMAVAASAFVAVPISAGAETERRTVYSLDYTTDSWTEGDTDGWAKTAGNFTPTFGVVKGTGFSVTPGTANSNYRDYTISKTLDKSYTGENVDITLVANTGTAQPQMTYYLTDDAGNTILSVTADRTNTKYIINGTDYTTLADGTTTINDLRKIAINDSTLTISANANFTTHTGTVSITIVGSNGATYSLVENEAFTFQADSFGGLKMVKSGTYSTNYTYNPNVLKSLSVVNDVDLSSGYTITTTPYSIVTVGDAIPVNSGASGVAVVPIETEGSKTVTITKPGYNTYEQTLNITIGGSKTEMLTPSESGVTYYEDFSQVNDQFGFDTTDKDSVVTVSDGKLEVSDLWTSKTGNNTVSTSDLDIDIANKLLTVNMMVNARSNNNLASLKLVGPNVRVFNFNQADIYFFGNNNTSNDMAGAISGRNAQYMNVQIDATNKKVYVDGKYLGTCTMAETTLTGFTASAQKGSQESTGISEIKVSSLPGEATITINDEGATNQSVSTTYLVGTQFTLPVPAGKTGSTFKGWKKDGDTDLLAAGTIVTATTTTYTAVYETITTAVSAYFVPKDSNVSVDGMTPVSGKYGGSKGSTVATAFTTSAIPTGASSYMIWDITVAADSFIKDADKTKFNSSTLIETAASGISKYGTEFKLRFGHALPTISGQPEIIFGLVINGLYAASGTTATAAYADSIPSNYDTITFGTLSSGNAVDGSVTNATTSETTAFGELMSIDSILTMMYDEDELAEITGDIASEDNADITGIDDEIDMTDYNDNGEAVGE